MDKSLTRLIDAVEGAQTKRKILEPVIYRPDEMVEQAMRRLGVAPDALVFALPAKRERESQ